jgi:hypothetical protein
MYYNDHQSGGKGELKITITWNDMEELKVKYMDLA